MNIYSLASFSLAAAVFIFGVLTATDNMAGFFDPHALLIVFGGTGAIAAISFQMDRIFMMLKVFYNRVIRGKKIDYVVIIKDLMAVAEAYRSNDPGLKEVINKTNDPFLREGMEMLIDGYLEHEALMEILSIRVETMFNRYKEDALKFKALGKFPPAMGLMGAVLGMIALLQNVGQPGADEKIGPAMAVALLATLYGIAFANLVILPIAENLMDGSREIITKNTIIVEGIRRISQKKNRVLLAEELNSYLLPGERINWKEVGAA